MPTSLSIALSALDAFFSDVPRVRKLTLGYKYFTATRFRDGLVPRPREGSAPRLRLFTGFRLYLRESASIRLRRAHGATGSAVGLSLPFVLFCTFSRLFPLPSRSLLASIRVYSWFQFAVRFA